MIALNRPFEILWLFLAPLFRLPADMKASIYSLHQWHHLFDRLDDGGWTLTDQEGLTSWSPIRPPP